MYEQVKHPKKNKRRAVSNTVSQKKNTVKQGCTANRKRTGKGSKSSSTRVIQLIDKPKVGVEVEIQNVYVKNHLKDDKFNPNVTQNLTTGGVDGYLKTEQVTEEKNGQNTATIEWASGVYDNKKGVGGTINDKKNILINGKKGSLSDYIKDIVSKKVNVGACVEKWSGPEVRVEATKSSGTPGIQTNVEIPFYGIGKEWDKTELDRSPAKLFVDKSEEKKIFQKSREVANLLLKEKVTGEDQLALTSLLTVFFHTNLLDSGSKDDQGILFKTGAGDLIRTALPDTSKTILWKLVHEDKDFSQNLLSSIKDLVTKGFSSVKKSQDKHEAKISEIEEAFSNQFKRLGEKKPEYIKASDTRWGEENTGYGNQVRHLDATASDMERDLQIEIAGPVTGKYFPINERGDENNSEPYIVAEVRSISNSVNRLVSDDQDTRRKARKKIKKIQKPLVKLNGVGKKVNVKKTQVIESDDESQVEEVKKEETEFEDWSYRNLPKAGSIHAQLYQAVLQALDESGNETIIKTVEGLKKYNIYSHITLAAEGLKRELEEKKIGSIEVFFHKQGSEMKPKLSKHELKNNQDGVIKIYSNNNNAFMVIK